MVVAEEAYYLRKYHVYFTWLQDTQQYVQCRGNLTNLNRYLEKNEFELQPIYWRVLNRSGDSPVAANSIVLETNGSLTVSRSILETEFNIFMGNINSLLNFEPSYFGF